VIQYFDHRKAQNVLAPEHHVAEMVRTPVSPDIGQQVSAGHPPGSDQGNFLIGTEIHRYFCSETTLEAPFPAGKWASKAKIAFIFIFFSRLAWSDPGVPDGFWILELGVNDELVDASPACGLER